MSMLENQAEKFSKKTYVVVFVVTCFWLIYTLDIDMLFLVSEIFAELLPIV